MKNLSTAIAESFQVNEAADDTIIVNVAEKAKNSLIKDLKRNSIAFKNIKGNQYEIESGAKTKMAIQQAKERFGQSSIKASSVDESFVNEAAEMSAIRVYQKSGDFEQFFVPSSIAKKLASQYNLTANSTSKDSIPEKDMDKFYAAFGDDYTDGGEFSKEALADKAASRNNADSEVYRIVPQR